MIRKRNGDDSVRNGANVMKMRTPARAAAWYLAGGALGKAIGLIATPIFTRLLSSEEYAILPLFMTWVGILGAFSGIAGSFGIRGRMLIERNKYGEGLCAALIGYTYLQLFICMLAYFALYPALSRVGAPSVGLSLLVFLELFIDGAIYCESTQLKANYSFRKASLIGIFLSLCPVVLSYIIISILGARGEFRVYGVLISGGVLAIPFIARALKSGRLYNKAVWQKLLRTELPLLPRGVAGALLLFADRLMITAYYGAGALSAYTISHSVGAAGGFIVTALGAAATPWVLRRLSEGRLDGVREALDSAVMLLILSAVLICGIAPEVVGFLAPSGYAVPLGAIAPLALSCVPSFLIGIMSATAAGDGRGFSAALPGIMAAGISIGLNALSFRYFPFEVAGLNYFIASIIGLIVAAALSRHGTGALMFSLDRLILSLLLGGMLCLTALAFDYSIAMRAVLILLAVVISLPLLLGFLVRIGIKRPPKSGGDGV